MRVLTVTLPGHVLRLGALRSVARTVPRAVGLIAVLAAVPAVSVAASGRENFAGALVAASLLAGAGVGYAADDPAAATLAASPTTLMMRRAARAILLVMPLAFGWAAALFLAARYGDSAVDVRAIALELLASAAVSAAIASRASTHAAVTIGFVAGVGALLTMVTVSALAYRWHALPVLGGGAEHTRWWWVAAVGLAIALWSSRDPAAGRSTR